MTIETEWNIVKLSETNETIQKQQKRWYKKQQTADFNQAAVTEALVTTPEVMQNLQKSLSISRKVSQLLMP